MIKLTKNIFIFTRKGKHLILLQMQLTFLPFFFGGGGGQLYGQIWLLHLYMETVYVVSLSFCMFVCHFSSIHVFIKTEQANEI